jgi:short-subunit dehydrogenase
MAKTFVVSGCASGIGKHMALALARAQHNIVMLDINGEALERVVQEHGLAGQPRITTRQHDVRDAQGWQRGFTLGVAHELAPDGVAVTVVCPDAVETPMLELQVGYEEAAMTFGGGRGLSLAEVERAIMHVLEHKPLELVLPVPGTGRGALAKLANAFPALTKLGLQRTIAQGRKTQSARK